MFICWIAIAHNLDIILRENCIYVFNTKPMTNILLSNMFLLCIELSNVVMFTEHEITEEIGCEDGTVASMRQRCLYDRARDGYTEGCRNFRHLENCGK